jgi:hypothetical protein
MKGKNSKTSLDTSRQTHTHTHTFHAAAVRSLSFNNFLLSSLSRGGEKESERAGLKRQRVFKQPFSLALRVCACIALDL